MALTVLALVTFAPSAAALVEVGGGDWGHTTAIRVHVDDALTVSCGRGNAHGNPSMDLRVHAIGDLLRDGEFDRYPHSTAPDTCHELASILEARIIL